MKSVFRVVLPGAVAALIVGLSVGFLAFTHAPPVGGFGFYARFAVGVVAFFVAMGVVWFMVVLIAQKRAFDEVTPDEDDDPFDDPFFDR